MLYQIDEVISEIAEFIKEKILYLSFFECFQKKHN